jgi:hypothetical protein
MQQEGGYDHRHAQLPVPDQEREADLNHQGINRAGRHEDLTRPPVLDQ